MQVHHRRNASRLRRADDLRNDESIGPVHITTIDPSEDSDLANRLLAIQRAAYLVEATLIDDDRIPALHEDVRDLCAASLQWLGAYDTSRLIGAVAWVEDADEVDIDRLIVHPAMHRRGAGRLLVQAVLHRAGQRRTTVSTGQANLPARMLYRKLRFRQLDDAEAVPGLWVTHLVHVH